jgi:DNA-binding IclR family transcriptional regulator
MTRGKTGIPQSIEGVSAVERALKVLTAFRRGDRALSLVDLADRTGLNKSTIMRLSASLESFGFLARTEDGTYRLDAECLRLGSLYQLSFELADHVRPALERLVDRTGETASFYVRRGGERLCLFRVESRQQIRLHVQPGDTRPMDRAAIAEVLRRYEKGMPVGGLDADLPLFSSGTTDIHTASMAMPVFGNGGILVGALAISGPVTRMTEEFARSQRDELRSAGQALTWLCGGSSASRAAAE